MGVAVGLRVVYTSMANCWALGLVATTVRVLARMRIGDRRARGEEWKVRNEP